MKILSLLFLFFIQSSAFSNVSVGTFSVPIGRVRNDNSSTEGPFNIRPMLGLFYKFTSTYPYIWDLEFDYVFPQESYEQQQEPLSKSRKMVFQMNLNWFGFSDFVYGIAGLSTVATKVYGDGGTVDVGTKTYYLPNDEGQTSYNSLVNLGVGLDFNKTLYAEAKAHIWEILNGQSRAVSLSLAFKWRYF